MTDTSSTRTKTILIDVLATVGILFWFGKAFIAVTPIPLQDDLMLKLAVSVTMLIQIVRGLIGQTSMAMPTWLRLDRLDKRFVADSTVVVLTVFGILEAALRGRIDFQSQAYKVVFDSLLAAQFIAGLWLFVLSLKRTNTNLKVALAGSLLFLFIFLSPILLVGGIAYALYQYLHLEGSRDSEMLAAAAIMPLAISVFMLSFKDRRNRWKNTKAVIITQLVALPVVPLCFLALRAFWPPQLSPMLFPVPFVLVPMAVLMVVRVFSRKEPWLVKEMVETLESEVRVAKSTAAVVPDVDSKLKEIENELAKNRLKLRTPEDHIDRGDACWKLGDLQAELSKSNDAEESYNHAVESFNDALRIDPANRVAIANKFKTVEALGQLKRQRPSADS
jgi:hypothetical protein